MLFVTVLLNKFHLISRSLAELFSIKRILFSRLLSRLVRLWLGVGDINNHGRMLVRSSFFGISSFVGMVVRARPFG
jgi:hypothetical protein